MSSGPKVFKDQKKIKSNISRGSTSCSEICSNVTGRYTLAKLHHHHVVRLVAHHCLCGWIVW
jgi:hypothetical protein